MAEKTNAIRLLENGNVPFRFYEYDVSDGRIDGKSIAEKIGESPDQVFKTLVTQAPPGKDYFVFVVPASGELDLKKAAKKIKEAEEAAQASASGIS